MGMSQGFVRNMSVIPKITVLIKVKKPCIALALKCKGKSCKKNSCLKDLQKQIVRLS